MPIVRRRIVALVTVACLSASLPAVAHAQSAGDQQYQDPFGNTTTSSAGSSSSKSAGSGSKSTPSSSSSSSTVGTLSPTPQGSAPSAGSSSSGSTSTGPTSSTATTTSTPAPTSSSSGGLPNTGADTRLVLAVGAILVLAGLGLRLRSGPERF